MRADFINASVDAANGVSQTLEGKSVAVVMCALALLLLQIVEDDRTPVEREHYRRLRRDLKLFTGELVCDSDHIPARAHRPRAM